MSQQQIHNLAEDNARFTSWGFRESKNGKNFEFLGLVGCIFVVLCVCVFLCVRQFTMWTRRDLAVHNIVHYRSPYCPKGEKNVDLLGLGLVRFFPLLLTILLLSLCSANHIGDITKYLNQCRGFVVLRGDFVASEPKIAPYMHDLGVARFTVQ
jgi:hypothetical protein